MAAAEVLPAVSMTPSQARRIHPSRAIRGAAVVHAGDVRSLRDARRYIVSEAGASLRKYAEKHVPAGAPLAGAVEDYLWPPAGRAPIALGSPEHVRAEAAAYRMFRPQVAADRVVAAWVAESGVAFALRALLAIDDFDLVLCWMTKPLVAVEQEHKVPGAPIDTGNRYNRTPGGSPELLLARELRRHLACADEAAHRVAWEIAAVRLGSEKDVFQRAILAYLFPDTPAWAVEATNALLARTGDEGVDGTRRRQLLRWMLSVPMPEGVIGSVLDALDDDLACLAVRDDSPIHTLVAILGAEAAERILAPRLARALEGRGWARARGLAEGLSALRSLEITRLFVEHATHKGLAKVAPEYFERHVDLALPRLIARVRAPKKTAQAVADLAVDLLRKHPPMRDVIANDAALADDFASLAARLPAPSASKPKARAAKPASIPNVLSDPPWARKKRAHERPTVELDLAPIGAEAHVTFGEGEKAAWLALADDPELVYVAKNVDVDAVNLAITRAPHNFNSLKYRRFFLAFAEIAALPALLAHARWCLPATRVDPISRVDAPEVMPVLAAVMAYGRASAPGFYHAEEAKLALLQRPATAALGLIPSALGPKGEPRDHAMAALELLVTGGHAEAIAAVADRYGAAARSALEPLLRASSDDLLARRASPMPKLWMPESLPRPVLAESGDPLPIEAVEALGQLLRRAEISAPPAAIASVRAACTQASLDAFAWEISKAWESAKGPNAQAFAVHAVGLLGSDALLRRLSDRIDAWAKTNKGPSRNMAIIALEALWASGRAEGVRALAGFAARAKEPSIRDAAAQIMSFLGRQLGLGEGEIGDRAAPSLGFADGEDVRPLIASEPHGLSLRITDGPSLVAIGKDGSPMSAPKGSKATREWPAAARAAWREAAEDLDDARKREGARFERALTDESRWRGAVFVRDVLGHPVLRRLAAALVFGVFDDEGSLVTAFRPASAGRLEDASGAPLALSLEGKLVGIAHPLHLGVDATLAFRDRIEALGLDPPFAQLDRPVRSAPSAWPVVRGTKIPHRRIEALLGRGYRLYRTHCSAPLHDQSYIEKIAANGRFRIAIGFNFGAHLGDSVLGDVLASRGTFGGVVSRNDALSPGALPAVVVSEVLVDLEVLSRA